MIAVCLGLILSGGVCAFIITLAANAQRRLRTAGYQSMLRYGKDMQEWQDKRDLQQKFGLSQLLGRTGGGLTAIGLSSGTMALIGGSALLFGPALQYGGLSVIGYGLPLLGLFYLCVSGSLAELSSAYPVAGSFYYASTELGGRRWGLRAGWFHAAGHLAVYAVMLGGFAYLIDSAAVSIGGHDVSGIRFWGITVLTALTHAAVHHFGASWLRWIHAGGVWLQLLIIVVVLTGLVWLFWPGGYSPALLYELQSLDLSGKVDGASFWIGLLLLMKLFLGMDGASQGAEETIEPRVRVPWGIFLSTAYTFVTGLALLTFMALTISWNGGEGGIPSSGGWQSGLMGMEQFMEGALSAVGGSPVIILLIMVSLWGSGLHSMSVCSRALFGLAREGALPFSKRLGSVSVRAQAPLNGGWVCAAVSVLLLIGSQIVRPNEAIIPLLAFAVVALHIAYAIPIGLRFAHWGPFKKASRFHQRVDPSFDSRWSSAPWQLGKWSLPVNCAAFLWLVGTAVLAAVLLDQSAAIGAAVLLLAVTAVEIRSSYGK